MLNRNEKLEIAKRLRLSTESEMSRDDLEKMLEEELAKPEEEMDAELVQLILEMLEDMPSSEQQRESWQKIDKELSSKRQWPPIMSGLTRAAAIIVFLIGIMFATYGTAKALNWEFLLRLMKPFAETFMLYSGDQPATTPIPEISNVYGDEMGEITQSEFASITDCPDKIAGYSAKPVWMPDRFTYLQGSMYTDMHMTSITHLFNSDAGICIVDIVILAQENKINSFSFEQIPEDATIQYIGGYQIAFYSNSDDEMLTASWMAENTHYSVTGVVSMEEMTCILESMMK